MNAGPGGARPGIGASAALVPNVDLPRSVPALDVSHLDVSYRVQRVWRPVLRDVSFRIERGMSYGLVGESGCGKSTAALAVVRYLARNGRIDAGAVTVDGTDVYRLSRASLRKLRSEHVSMVYQNPLTALNPSMRVGAQVAEVFEVGGATGDEALDRARGALERVQIADPGSVLRRYPHQLSGGMAQRVVVAMALANDPSLLILDEPTTGLDATVEAEVLDLVAGLRADMGTAVLFISHNLGVIRRMCDDIGVLYAGRMVEQGPTGQVFAEPRHPYTVGLLRAIPRAGARKSDGPLDTIPGFLPVRPADVRGCVFVDRCGIAQDACRVSAPPLVPVDTPTHLSRCFVPDLASTLPRADELVRAPDGAVVESSEKPVLLRVSGVGKTFRQEGAEIRALRDVDLVIHAGETLGLVGESGSGKSTLAKAIIGMHAPDSGGSIELDGRPLEPTVIERTAEQLRSVQIVFQNPDSALNPSYPVRRIVGRAITRLEHRRGADALARTTALTRSVQLADHYLDARPSQLSGGLKQRVAIARAFAGPPRLVVCDEPTSALDVSVQAAILNLLVDLQERMDVAYLFISHDLGVVRYISDRIAVMYLGEIVEVGPAAAVFDGPHHPYTEALLSAVARTEGEGERARIKLEGEIPSAAAVPSGCPFTTRCPRRVGDICDTERPPVIEIEPGHWARCHLPVDQLGGAGRPAPVPVTLRRG